MIKNYLRKIRTVVLVVSALLCSIPAKAVFNEKDLAQTLQVLRYELCKAYSEMSIRQQSFEKGDENQHKELVKLIQDCNELSLMLYSQKQDFTFDLTYALQRVTDRYHSFTQSRMPYDNIISYLDVEIERYDRLLTSLRKLPPELVEIPDSLGPKLMDSLVMSIGLHNPGESFSEQHADDPDHAGHGHEADSVDEHDHGTFNLDSLSMVDRDSCIFYSTKLLKMFTDLREHMVEDSEYYETTNKRLKEAYDYAQERYKLVQRRIFIEGQSNYWVVLKNLPRFLNQGKGDFNDKYGNAFMNEVKSEWRGPKVLGFSFSMLIFLAVSILLSNLLVRLLKRRVRFFQTESFQKREFAILLLISLLIFMIVITLAKSFTFNAHFFEMASTLLIEYAFLLIAIVTSILIRQRGFQVNDGLFIYVPVMLMGLLVISFRIIFIPNSLINLIYSPILLCFVIWQFFSLRRRGDKVPKVDRNFAVASFVVTVLTLLVALAGYSLFGLQIYIWWIFQLTVLQVIMACRHLLRKYHDSRVKVKIRAYRVKHQTDVSKNKGAYIMVTWFYDLLDMALIPMLIVISFPMCLYMASMVFDLTEVCMNAFFYLFFSYDFLHLSISRIVVISLLFFLFRYINYAAKSFYRIYKLRSIISKAGDRLIRENEVNLTLPNNVIGILAWGTYCVIIVSLLKIPTKSLEVVTAGLMAGLGFAMKDILNNFFYGVQLMSGRLRVGDTVECDGVRGKVDSINYQTTQILGLDGSLIAFPNSVLFAKSFKNLTRSDDYEFVAIPVGVAYGTDIDFAKKVILKALAPLCRPDRFGSQMVKKSFGIEVILSEFGDSSVNLLVRQFVLVESRMNYIARANEAIYKALNENNIEIPFPQVDLNFKNPLPVGEEEDKQQNQ